MVPSEVAEVTLDCAHSQVRTGDVVYFEAVAKDDKGNPVVTPISFSVISSGGTAKGAFATVREDGAFVAEEPGFYTVNAIAGGQVATQSIKVDPRNVQRDIEVVGRGNMTAKHTTDFWIWEGL